jgi:hypothetical protein
MDKFIKHFVRVEPGMWTCVKSGEYYGPNGRVQVNVGSSFRWGTTFMGFDLARALEDQYEKGRKTR